MKTVWSNTPRDRVSRDEALLIAVGIIESIFIRSFRQTEVIIDYLPPASPALEQTDQAESGQPENTE